MVETPARSPSGSLLAVILSGDGGWVTVDKQMAGVIADKGIPVVGFDTPSYVSTTRTPDGAAADLSRLLERYLAAWHKERVLLIGYSHGANLLPFMISRLSPELRHRIVLVAFLGLEDRASFQFHPVDVVLTISHPGDLPVLPEVQKLRGMPLLCVRGTSERNSLCSRLDTTLTRLDTHTGGHRISGSDGKEVANLILKAVPS